MEWDELREKLTLEKGACSGCFVVPAGGPRVVFSLTNKGLGHQTPGKCSYGGGSRQSRDWLEKGHILLTKLRWS